MAQFENDIPAEAYQGLNRAIMLHMFDPNVSLIDIGWRIRDRNDHSVEEDELCVRVHVRRKLRGEVLEAFAETQPERVIDPKRIGFPVDVPGSANYRLQQWPWYTPIPTSPRGRVFNPLRGGISVSSLLLSTYGTMGGKVKDRRTGRDMILSNWHVLAASWYAWEGMPIYQPGQGDGGYPYYTVARFSRHAMDNLIDAAVAELEPNSRPLINDQLDIGPVKGLKTPQLGMRVTKSGRGSGITTGIITGVEGRQVMNYDGVQRVIRHVVHIAQDEEGGSVSKGGDSGAWWLERETNHVVGLHFAGADDPEYGLAISMPPVLDALNVDLVTEHEPQQTIEVAPEQPLVMV